MIKYKLTDENMQTYGNTQWVLGETKTTSGEGNLCGPGWLHVYHDPILAILLNPIHADFNNPRLFECECGGDYLDGDGLKAGFTSVTLVREIPVPQLSVEQKVKFAILCALEVYHEPSFVEWANNWLSGKNRAAEAAEAAAWAAAWAAWAAGAAGAARAAEAAGAARAAEAAAWATEAAGAAAWAAAWAAEAAGAAAWAEVDLISIAHEVIR